jgi:(2Fe-2S) ferredoxin
MVLVIPDRIWYSRVCASEVPAVVERHLQGGQPVTAMLYPKYHRIEQRSLNA